jgi:outer membrane receptor protein involved in Fe transport
MKTLPQATAVLAAAFFSTSAIAQTQTANDPVSANSAKNEETIVLSPFVVSTAKDFGYRSSASSTGTGFAGLIKDTPMNISVISHELIDDQGGNQLVDILRNSSAVAAHTKDEGVILVRGYSGQRFIDGLPAGGQGYTLYDIDRVEVVKGPNAVFAGLSNPGGTINMIKMKPTFKAAGSVVGELGDYGHNRFIARASGPLVADKIAYLFVYGHTDEKSYIDYMFTDERYYSGAITFKPVSNLTMTARYSDLRREAGRRPYLTVSNAAFQQADRDAISNYDAKGLARPSSAPQLENNAVAGIITGRAAPEDVVSWTGRTFGPNVPPFTLVAFEDFFGRSSYNYNGPEGRDNYFSKITSFEGEYVVNHDLAFRALYQAAQGGRLRREFNGFRPVAGQRLRSGASDFNEDSDIWNAKLEVSHKIDLGVFGKQDILAGFQYSDGKRVTHPSFNTPAINFSPRTQPVPRLLEMLQSQFGAGYTAPGTMKTSQPANRSAFAVLQSSFFGDRVRTIAGGRVTENRAAAPVTRTTSPQFGALGRLTSWLSAYASYSKTFVPQSATSANLAAIRATQGDPTSPGYVPPSVIPTVILQNNLSGEGREAGLKFDLKDNEVVGTLTYFQTEEANRLEVDTVNQVLYQLPGGAVRTPAGLTRTRGVESEIIWTPVHNYQAILSGSYFFEADEVTNPADAREVGSHLEAVPKYTVTIWNKYTVVSGPLKGAYIGGGITALGSIGIHPSWTVPIRSAPVTLVNLIAGYRHKYNGLPIDYRLNLENLTDRKYLNGTFQYGEPLSVVGSVRIEW